MKYRVKRDWKIGQDGYMIRYWVVQELRINDIHAKGWSTVGDSSISSSGRSFIPYRFKSEEKAASYVEHLKDMDSQQNETEN